MFTSKLSELVDSNFQSVQPFVCLDSLYYEQASTTSDDSTSYTVERQSVYKHLTPLVNPKISQNIINDFSVGETSAVEKHEGDIKLNMPLFVSKYSNDTSYVQLKSAASFSLNNVMNNFVTGEILDTSLKDVSENLTNYGKKYINDLSTKVDYLSYNASNAIKNWYDLLDHYNSSIRNTSINEQLKEIDSSLSILDVSVNKYEANSKKYLAMQYVAKFKDLLNICADTSYGYEQVYIWEVFKEMMDNSWLIPGKIYKVLYYPRKENHDFSIPLVLEILAVTTSEISKDVKVRNSIDPLTNFFKQEWSEKDVSEHDIIDIINVYNLKESNNDYILKPVFLQFPKSTTNSTPIIFYDDYYGLLKLYDDCIYITNNNDIYQYIAECTKYACSYSVSYLLVALLLYKFYDEGIIELDECLKSILSMAYTFDMFNKFIKTCREMSFDEYVSILKNINYNDYECVVNLKATNNIFHNFLTEESEYDAFGNAVEYFVDNNRQYYNEYIINGPLSNINVQISLDDNKLALQIYNAIFNYVQMGTFDEHSSFYNAINIYYDTYIKNSNAAAGLLYNGDPEFYNFIKSSTNNMFDNYTNWIFNEYTDYCPEVFQGGKVVPYELWKAHIYYNNFDYERNVSILEFDHLIDDKNNEADYDFRSIPTYVIKSKNASVFGDDLFWQTYYTMAANKTYTDGQNYHDAFNVDDTIRNSYAIYETRNNIILKNNMNISQITWNKNFYIGDSIYEFLIDSENPLRDYNTENIKIKNNIFSNYVETIIEGTNFAFENNDVTNSSNETLLSLNNSNIKLSNINVFVYVSNGQASLTSLNSYIYNSSIQQNNLDSNIIIENSQIVSSTINWHKIDAPIYINNSYILNALTNNDSINQSNNCMFIGNESQTLNIIQTVNENNLFSDLNLYN